MLSGSYEPVIQIDAPPRCQVSPGQVSLPGSPGPGMVCERHTSSPVSGSRATTKPRMPRSPPEAPTITFPLATSGAIVM